MTIDQARELTPDEVRVRIAEACLDADLATGGFEPVQNPAGTMGYRQSDLSGMWIYHNAKGDYRGMNYPTPKELRAGEIRSVARANNYWNDLNVCAQFEQTLRGNAVRLYEHHLERIVFKDTSDDDWSEEKGISANVRAFHASAPQRCLAFLVTTQP